MPAGNEAATGNEQSTDATIQNSKRTLTPDQVRELTRKLYAMLRRDLEIERERFGK